MFHSCAVWYDHVINGRIYMHFSLWVCVYSLMWNLDLDLTIDINDLLGNVLAFYMVFYSALLVIFIIHLAVFIILTPPRSVGTTPWNFGRYAYTNYPNRKLGKTNTYTCWFGGVFWWSDTNVSVVIRQCLNWPPTAPLLARQYCISLNKDCLWIATIPWVVIA